MKYTVSQARKNFRELLNAADAGEEVIIERFEDQYQLIPLNVNVKTNSDGTVSAKDPGKLFAVTTPHETFFKKGKK